MCKSQKQHSVWLLSVIIVGNGTALAHLVGFALMVGGIATHVGGGVPWNRWMPIFKLVRDCFVLRERGSFWERFCFCNVCFWEVVQRRHGMEQLRGASVGGVSGNTARCRLAPLAPPRGCQALVVSPPSGILPPSRCQARALRLSFLIWDLFCFERNMGYVFVLIWTFWIWDFMCFALSHSLSLSLSFSNHNQKHYQKHKPLTINH